jgi:UDP-N-acetylenolpyruvoylglucosamine reductase
MVSPFTVIGKGKNTVVSDAFIDFVYKNLLGKQKIKKEKIRELYRDFIQEYGQDAS